MSFQLVLQGDQALLIQQQEGEEEGDVTEEVEGEEEAHSEEEEAPNPVLPTGNEILFAVICFFALWTLMKFVLLPPIQKGRQERADKVRAELDAAERARDGIGTRQAEYQKALAGARAEANGLIDAARAAADTRRAELQAAAEADIAGWRAEAQAELDQARVGALAGMKGDVSTLAVEAASLVVQKPLDGSSVQSVIDQALQER